MDYTKYFSYIIYFNPYNMWVDITPTLQVKRKRLTDWVYKGLYTAYTF